MVKFMRVFIRSLCLKKEGKKNHLKQKVTIIVSQTLLVWYMIMIEAGNIDFKGSHLPLYNYNDRHKNENNHTNAMFSP